MLRSSATDDHYSIDADRKTRIWDELAHQRAVRAVAGGPLGRVIGSADSPAFATLGAHTGDMTIAPQRRGGFSKRVMLASAAIAIVLICGVSFVVWQALEGDARTLRQSEHEIWLTWTLSAVAAALIAVLATWRFYAVRAGLAIGTVLAVLAILARIFLNALSAHV